MSGAIAAPGAAADPRLAKSSLDHSSYPNRVLTTLHDTNISFEEYIHYANLSRSEESRLFGPGSNYKKSSGPVKRFVVEKVGRKRLTERKIPPAQLQFEEKKVEHGSDSPNEFINGPAIISEEEWLDASRAARTAAWGAIFYLITTDILGPFSVPWAFSQLGYGPAVSLYTIFGILSGYGGWQLWRMFTQIDSDRYPLKGYGDLAFRIFGPWARHVANVLQSFQFFFGVALLILQSGQSISQMSHSKLCFIVCIIVSAIAGCIIGQVRTLARFGWLATLAVVLNIIVILFTMGIVSTSDPNYTAVAASYPAVLPDPANPASVSHTGGSPPGLTFIDNINGLMQAVYSYGGATLFCELMAEMRRPMDFWKSLLCGEIFIYLCYLIHGLVVYSYQGQYAFNPSYQGINPYTWQTTANAMELITGLIAACLYGNIGIKVLYNNIGREFFGWPVLEARKGKWLWVILVPVYWGVAFVVSVSIPQISVFSAFVGAACILQFTYTFPPLLMLGFKAQRDAILPEETFDPMTGRVERMDSGMKRWIRGLKKDLLWNTWDLVFGLGAATTAVLGIYASVSGMVKNYSNNANLTGWSCKSPTG